MQKYKDTLRITKGQTNVTTSLHQNFSTFDMQDSTKLEDWLTNLETYWHVNRMLTGYNYTLSDVLVVHTHTLYYTAT